MKTHHITANFSGKVRKDQMEGRNYLVAPMVMITEGVHSGSGGPIFYSNDELGKSAPVWNHKPVVVYHPMRNGQNVSACDPDTLTMSKVGVIMNSRFEDGKLKAEAWLDETRVNTVDSRVLDFVEKDELMELSTGLFMDHKVEAGEFNGKKYEIAAHNCRPDHLALLPDQKGACSIEDGAGFLRVNKAGDAIVTNEMSHSNIYSSLSLLVRKKYGDESYLEDVYSNFLVFWSGEKYLRVAYSMSDNQVQLEKEMGEVVRVTEWRAEDGSFVGNFNQDGKDSPMDKKAKVEALISNERTKWAEEDREFLLEVEESKLDRIVENSKEFDPNPPEEQKKVREAAEEGAKGVAGPPAKKKEEEPETNEKPSEVTAEEYIAQAPSEIRDMLESGLSIHNQEKKRLVDTILANERNVFTEDVLSSKPLNELRGLASLAEVTEPSSSATVATPSPSFAGAATPPPVGNTAPVTEEPLVMPAMDFSA